MFAVMSKLDEKWLNYSIFETKIKNYKNRDCICF